MAWCSVKGTGTALLYFTLLYFTLLYFIFIFKVLSLRRVRKITINEVDPDIYECFAWKCLGFSSEFY